MSDASDDPVLARINDAFDGVGEVPQQLTDAAKHAFSWRRPDAALAKLLSDSSTDELVGIRGNVSDRRSFRFGHGDFVIRAHLTAATLIVMVEPPLSVACRVVTNGGVDDQRTDEYGEVVMPAPELPLRVEVDLPDGTVVTPWITG